jgi:hypothetical protein
MHPATKTLALGWVVALLAWAPAQADDSFRITAVGGSQNPPGGSVPTAAQIRASMREQIVPHGRRSKIGALLKRDYRLSFRSLVAGTAKVRWLRPRKGAKPILIAGGHRTFDAAGKATIRMKLSPAGRRRLRRSAHLRLTAVGTYTMPDASVRATRRFTIRRS